VGTVHDFNQARANKYSAPVYVAPKVIEVPESIREAAADQRAKQQRGLMRIAVKLIDSSDIPPRGEAAENETPPAFDYPSTETEQ
jgi:hypothetical protein